MVPTCVKVWSKIWSVALSNCWPTLRVMSSADEVEMSMVTLSVCSCFSSVPSSNALAK
jgi:hypothetical protein